MKPEREILLPLEREYTDKEKLGLVHQMNARLIKQLKAGEAHNRKLSRQLEALRKERDDLKRDLEFTRAILRKHKNGEYLIIPYASDAINRIEFH